MSRVAYVNGAFVPHRVANVHIEDRGYQFADGVYEVWAVRDGRLLENEGHFDRLARSLGELRIRPPMSRASLAIVLRETVRRNRVRNGIAYLQITRGVAPRDHAFPPADVAASMVITAKQVDLTVMEARAREGIGVVTTPDNRWGRCDIKTIGLLPNVLAKQAAREAGAFEAWFIDSNGHVTEGASTNAWIVSREGALVTRGTDANILRGVTRAGLIAAAKACQMRVEERAFSLDEAKSAPEAFVSSAFAIMLPVVSIDGVAVGEGRPGPVAARLREAYLATV